MTQDADFPPVPRVTPSQPAKVRAHLSIGEVLSLLQQDYPDITISKIRFLESQGLLNPERTPSGYRKFYDQDVEQLRWVLRQQKENFLPLKVIKDRLAAGRLDAPASDSGVLDLNSTTEVRSRPGDGEGDGKMPSMVVGELALPVGTPEPANNGPETNGDASTPRKPARTPLTMAATVAPHAGSDTHPGDRAGLSDPATDRHGVSVDRPTDRPMDLGVEFSSVSMSAHEICTAAGITPLQLAELERYGLVTHGSLGHDAVYGEDALLVANLAGALGSFGLDARHLRMFKTAAEREAGMYEQIALPRLRANRPDSHRQAIEDVARIAGLAEQLHRALLRDALRSVLGPG